MDNKQWFAEAKFGLMVHWGLYSIIGGEWQGKRMGDMIGEWAQSYFRIPNKTYHKLADCFNPIFFDADEWVATAKAAGAQYLVVTSKHHDGFALFGSEASPFNVCDATPFGRDVIGELSDACHRQGLKLGLYYSQALDWSEEHGGGYDEESRLHINCGKAAWSNDWDYPDYTKKDFSICFEKKIKPQVKEILTKYGDLCLIWFDTPRAITAEQSQELYDMVKHYQPDCLVNSRIGNGLGDYQSTRDNEIPDDKKDCLFESPATLNGTWGYKSYDNDWKSPARVLEIKNHLNERGINYLLNVGPDHLGRFPAPAVEILKEVGRQL